MAVRRALLKNSEQKKKLNRVNAVDKNMIKPEERLKAIVKIAQNLGSGRPFSEIFKNIMATVQDASGSEGGSLYIYDEKSQKLKGVLFANSVLKTESVVEEFDPLKIAGLIEVDMRDSDGRLRIDVPSVASFINKETVVIKDLDTNKRFDFYNTKKFDEQHNYKTNSMMVFPLLSHNGSAIGVLQTININSLCFKQDYMEFILALTAQVGLALSNSILVTEAQNLLSAMIQMIVVAIDEKSHHTSGHCQRVTELTMMIADTLTAEQEGMYKDFSLSSDQRRELYLAALLHDVGKVVTPTHILEKPTKLFALHDRIDLLCERLLAWQLSERYKRLVAAVKDAGQEDILKDIEAPNDSDEDLNFLGLLNSNEIPLDEEAKKRLDEIGQRYISIIKKDRAVISSNEMNNLKITRGTLNAEEREIMEEHVSISIRLLSSIPWPKNLGSLVEYAGAHHENLNGTGYPHRLKKEDLSIPARILGLADRFEGISAPDRPYRKTKMTLSSALIIMHKMRDDEHIDSDLFDLFINKKIYMDYARRHLPSELIDCS